MSEAAFEELVKRVKDRAAQLLQETWNCAYSPFKALVEALDLDVSDEVYGSAIAFAGGISGNKHICGGLWAAIAAVGAYARKRMKLEGRLPEKAEGPLFIQSNQEIHDLASEVYREFIRTWNSPNCGDLNPNFDLVSSEQQRKCRAIVRKSAEIALRVLARRYGYSLGTRGV